MRRIRLSQIEKENRVRFQLRKVVPRFQVRLNETISKYKLNEKPNTQIKIIICYYNGAEYKYVLEKYYPLLTVKEDFPCDVLENIDVWAKILADELWGFSYEVYFFDALGNRKGGITGFDINPDAWNNEYYQSIGVIIQLYKPRVGDKSIRKLIVTVVYSKKIEDKNMATAIKAIPTLHGKEAKEFLRHAEEAERNFKGFKNIEDYPFCVMARSILEKAGMR